MNGLQFLALVLACAYLFYYATKKEKTMNNVSEWPTGKNPVLTILKEDFDNGDAWGSNIAFLFALCDIATKYEIHIPAELQYVASPFGQDEDNYRFKLIEGLLGDEMYIHRALTLEEFKGYVAHALKVCARYDKLLRLAGEDY